MISLKYIQHIRDICCLSLTRYVIEGLSTSLGDGVVIFEASFDERLLTGDPGLSIKTVRRICNHYWGVRYEYCSLRILDSGHTINTNGWTRVE